MKKLFTDENKKTKRKSLSARFHKLSSNDQLDYKVLPFDKWKESWKKISYKEYPRFPKIKLETDDTLLITKNLRDSLVGRRSQREFSDKKLSFKELSTLLHYSAGINSERTNEYFLKRFIPSGGTRFPIELYVLANGNNVDTLDSSSYHYNIKRNCLEKMFNIDNFKAYIHQVAIQDFIQDSSVLICLSAVFNRSRIKYGERGYRYCMLEAGHIAQNIYLLSSALNLKCCSIGGFSDAKINKHLELEEDVEAVLYLVAIGK